MATKTVASALKGLKGAWKKAEARVGFSPVPDGQYQARIDNAVLELSKSSKRPQISYELTIVSGEYENRKLWKRDGIDGEEQLEWTKGTLETLDLEIPDNINDLPDCIDGAKGLGVEITVRTKEEFQNIYFNELLDLDDVVDEDEEEDEDEEGD